MDPVEPLVDDEPVEPSPPPNAHDRMGLARLAQMWMPTMFTAGRTRWKTTVDMSDLQPGVFAAVVAEEADEYSFEVEGKELWLGRVSQPFFCWGGGGEGQYLLDPRHKLTAKATGVTELPRNRRISCIVIPLERSTRRFRQSIHLKLCR